ncbi:MAG: CopG family transcriptional regulator [Gammaproteobacteria bacterium]
MKTTLDLSDGVLERAKEHAMHEGRTLRAVVEDALRLYLNSLESSARPRPGLAIQPWGRGGMQPQYRDKSWSEILDEVNERPLPDEPAG